MHAVPLPNELSTCRDAAGAEHALAVGEALLEGTLTLPLGARALVVLVHASSAGRFAARNRFLGEALGQAGFATFQVDLLTPAEEATLPLASHRNQDTWLLATRALGVIDWLKNQAATCRLALGILAAPTEIVAALITAERASGIGAVVCQGACPDFFDGTVTQLCAPTLFIVGQDELTRAHELASEFFARHLLAK